MRFLDIVGSNEEAIMKLMMIIASESDKFNIVKAVIAPLSPNFNCPFRWNAETDGIEISELLVNDSFHYVAAIDDCIIGIERKQLSEEKINVITIGSEYTSMLSDDNGDEVVGFWLTADDAILTKNELRLSGKHFSLSEFFEKISSDSVFMSEDHPYKIFNVNKDKDFSYLRKQVIRKELFK